MIRCSHDWSSGRFQAKHEIHSLQYEDTEEEVMYWIKEMIKDKPSYGTRRVTETIRRSGICVNRKKVRSYMLAMGLVDSKERRKRIKAPRAIVV